MADNLTNDAEGLMLDWLHGVGNPARPTTPLKCRLMTMDGTDSAAGTEAAGGTYTPQSVTLSTAAGTGITTNSGDLSYSGMPACTVTGVEIWDSAGSPVRLWYGTLTTPRTVNAGDTLVIPAGDLDLSLG